MLKKALKLSYKNARRLGDIKVSKMRNKEGMKTEELVFFLSCLHAFLIRSFLESESVPLGTLARCQGHCLTAIVDNNIPG